MSLSSVKPAGSFSLFWLFVNVIIWQDCNSKRRKFPVRQDKYRESEMSIQRYGMAGSSGTVGQHLPFSRAVEAGGWLYVSGQTPMKDGEIVEGGIVEQSQLAIQNCVDIMIEAGYGLEDVVHVSVILTDARYFASFNRVFQAFFGQHPPARICAVADLVVDCKVEVDVTCYRAP